MALYWTNLNTIKRTTQTIELSKIRTKMILLSSTFFLLVHCNVSNAQDIRLSESYILDQSCVEKKISYCLIENITFPLSITTVPCQKGLERVKYRYGDYCKFRDIDVLLKAVTNHYSPIQLKDNNAVTLISKDYDLAYNNCKTLVENFPSQYAPKGFTQSCLKPLAQERLLNAIGIEIKRLRSSECTDEDCSKLDKVPPQ